MRGTPRHAFSTFPIYWIIPAYAGNTAERYIAQAGRWDHPRVCGEHDGGDVFQNGREGSSPRMRGTRARIRADRIPDGIIPAYAGNTCRLVRWVSLAGDHPRVCGEHGGSFAFVRDAVGSSPRMRGTPTVTGDPNNGVGIIPAYAGNTRVIFFELVV